MLSRGIPWNMPLVTCICDAWHIPRYPTRKHCITSMYAYVYVYMSMSMSISLSMSMCVHVYVYVHVHVACAGLCV